MRQHPHDLVLPVPADERADAGWLQLRRGADTRTRDEAAEQVLAPLLRHLAPRCPPGSVLQVVDVGAGTGANRAYLAPRLPVEQSWVVVDHDADLLDHVDHGSARRVLAGVGEVSAVLADLPPGPRLLTCAALLDVLTLDDLARLTEAVHRSGVPALLALSVTGQVRWSPADEEDDLLGQAFDAHQRRGGRAGPDAPAVLQAALTARGVPVITAATPWRLDASAPALLGRWLDERVEAALAALAEDDADARQALLAWHGRRRAQLASAGLAAQVEHVDLLVLPDGTPGRG